MITKMKKITFLAYHKEYESFLNSLRELGVVHTVEKQRCVQETGQLLPPLVNLLMNWQKIPNQS